MKSYSRIYCLLRLKCEINIIKSLWVLIRFFYKTFFENLRLMGCEWRPYNGRHFMYYRTDVQF